MMFVLHHLNEILELLMEPGKKIHIKVMFCIIYLSQSLHPMDLGLSLWDPPLPFPLLPKENPNCNPRILYISESNLSGTSSSESCLTLEAVDALGFLFNGTMDGKYVKSLCFFLQTLLVYVPLNWLIIICCVTRKVQPLEDLARLQPESNKSGYSKVRIKFNIFY